MVRFTSDDGALAIKAKYLEACQIAGSVPPDTESSCQEFAARCVKGAKVKAELFAKVSQIHLKHAEALDWAAKVAGFPDGWHGLTAYAKQFPVLSPAARDSDIRSVYLTTAAWVLTDELVAQYPFAATYVRLLGDMLHGSFMDAESGEIVLRKVFFRSEYAPRTWQGYSPKDLTYIFHDLLAWRPYHFVTSLLSRVPVIADREATWPPLSSITVEDLLTMPLANPGMPAGFGYRGWEHGVASMQEPLSQWASLKIGSWLHPENAEEQRKVKERAEAPSTRLSCRSVLEEQLRPLYKLSVLEAVSKKKGANGFISQWYSGTPEEAEAALQGEFRCGSGRLKRVIFREPCGEKHFLTIFRYKYPVEGDDGAACYNAEAMLHNAQDELVAQVSLVLSAVPVGYSLTDFVSHLDGTNDNDVQELALSVVDAAVDEGAFFLNEWQHLLFVRDWEVREQDRGQGLGRNLLRIACKKAFKGLPGPTAVAAKVWPLHLQPTCREVSPGIPEIEGPVERLKAFWESKVIGGGVLPKSIEVDILAGYYPLMQGSDSRLELLALGLCRRKAMGYGG